MTAQLELPSAVAPMRTSKRRSLRVALLTNENTPYRVPLYRELAATPGWEFQVFTCIDREFDRLWDVTATDGFNTKQSYSLKYMRRQNFGEDQKCVVDKEVHLPVGIVPDMFKFRPDVVLSNEFGVRTLLASLTAKLTGHKLIVYNEGTNHTESFIGRSQRLVRKLLRSIPDAYICNGVQSRQYLESLKVPAESIFEVGQALDLESFDQPVSDFERETFRQQHNISGVCYLYVGQIVKFKGTDNLFRAWNDFCRKSNVDATLLFAGEGNDRKFLESEVAEAGLTNVRVLGFVPRKDLAKVCAAADVFVFPTLRDCFSLAFEEAMAAGLPVIGSIYGGESELVEEGVNGWVCDPIEIDDLHEKLVLAYEARHELPQMGERARQAVARMAIDQVAERIRLAVDYALDKPKSKRLP